MAIRDQRDTRWIQVLLILIFVFSVNCKIVAIPFIGDSLVTRSIYPSDMMKRSKLYNKLWGKHYRDIYGIPIRVTAITPETFRGGSEVIGQADNFQGLLLEDKNKNHFLLKALGGSTSFLESQFFREMYNHKDFQGTYLDSFIGDAYTIINPYTFIVADHLAEKTGLNTNDSHIYYIADNNRRDTVAGGWAIQDRLVNISELTDIDEKSNVITTGEMLEKIRSSSNYAVDKEKYVRSRLYDLLIGDWNKIPENWTWEAQIVGDSILFSPIVIDRNHAFTKVDGLFLGTMLSALSLPFIVDYDPLAKNLKKGNSLALPLDKTLLPEVDEAFWIEQAQYIQSQITDAAIDEAFALLPGEISVKETGELRGKLQKRRDNLDDIARRYVAILKKTKVVDGIDSNGYNNIKYHTNSFTPIGVYDSDYGGSLALYYTYTMYAAKRNPFTYQHQIGYNFMRGFYYQGIFPFNNPKASFQMDVFLGNPQNFQNFFGYGNETDGYKDEKHKYNRAYVNQYTATPSIHYQLRSDMEVFLSVSFDRQKVKREDGYFVSNYYGADHSLFQSNYFLDIKGSFQTETYLSRLFPRMQTILFAGWNMKLKDASHNIPYLQASFAIDCKLTDRLMLATQLNAKAIFSDTYYFYQAASIDLRGFRDNRFIGKQSFYQFTDLRLDMGRLENPFTPIKYGFFAGMDYGRVWYPGEDSHQFHTSYGGGLWLIFINKLTTKYTWFGSSDSFRFALNLTLDF